MNFRDTSAAIALDRPPLVENALMPRATVEAIVHQRNHVLRLYEQAHQALTSAHETLQLAHGAERKINDSREDRFTYHLRGDKTSFMHIEDVQTREEYMKVATRIVDTDVWSKIIEITDLQKLMDKEAREGLFQQLLTEPPEVTVENIYATVEQFALDADMIFRRGIANAFSKLDRRFKSHDGFKIGNRVILDRMFDENGWFNYHRDMEATLFDIARTFLVLDGSRVPEHYAGIVGKLRNTRTARYGAHQSETQDEYFLIRAYKNGNAHLWFKRDDLVEKVNKLLGEYYGEVVGDAMTEAEDDGDLFKPKTTPAKRYGFFPTPDEAADTIMEHVPLLRQKDNPPLRILEPSAGTGNLARRCFTHPAVPEGRHDWQIDRANQHNAEYRFDNIVDCVEIQPELVAALRAEGIYQRVYSCDFLSLSPSTTGKYHRIVMNPPFDRERDIDHVMHALDFLEDTGYLIAIMSAGTEFRETRKSIAFRKTMQKLNASFRDLPAGSFSTVGTNVNTCYVRLWKNGSRIY
jgi:Domain of unknown function (DUF4942)